MNSQEIRGAATSAAEAIIVCPPAPDIVFTREDVLESGGVPASSNCMTVEEARERSFLELQFFEHWRYLISVALGRYPKTVRGEGFRLLAPGEVSSEMTDEAFRKAIVALHKAHFVVKNVRNQDLSMGERRQKLDDLTRLAWGQQALREARRKSISKRTRPIIQTTTTQTIPTIKEK